MRLRSLSLPILVAVAWGCSNDSPTTAPVQPPPPEPTPVLLRDVVHSSLPAPYYHFEYDRAGRVKAVSFASGLRMYDVSYDGDRISEMQNNVIVNHDRLQYVYDEAGRVAAVKYVDTNGQVFTAVFLTYDGKKLTGLERDRRVAGGFIVEKTVSLTYYPDGNLRDLTEHRPATGEQPVETTTMDHFEDYDTGINVDGFGLIHDDFFDHLVLLPGVELQKGNPRRQTRTGDGLNFTITYAYTYDGAHRPLLKQGEVTLTNGNEAGRRLPISSEFSYYDQ